MIGQYLSNTNESATISILQNFLELCLYSGLSERTRSKLSVDRTYHKVVNTLNI